MKRIIIIMLMIFLGFSGIFSCSGSEGKNQEKGKIDEMTDKAAEEISDHIKKPMEKAKEVEKLQQERMKEVDEAAGNQ